VALQGDVGVKRAIRLAVRHNPLIGCQSHHRAATDEFGALGVARVGIGKPCLEEYQTSIGWNRIRKQWSHFRPYAIRVDEQIRDDRETGREGQFVPAITERAGRDELVAPAQRASGGSDSSGIRRSSPGFYLYHPSRRQTPPALRALISALKSG